MSAITSGREVALTKGLINFTNSLPASIFTPALLYVVVNLLKSFSSSELSEKLKPTLVKSQTESVSLLVKPRISCAVKKMFTR
jgi:hypothetical protein